MDWKFLTASAMSPHSYGGNPVTAAEANRLFYSEIAASYDVQEFCVVDPGSRALVRSMLSVAVAATDKTDIRALDACGGSGYASGILLGMGVTTVLVDISREMLDRWAGNARSLGHDAEIQEAEIGDFLSQSKESWDLIVFSSALHHIENYRHVVGLAADSLAPGGVLVTMFDPTLAGRRGRLLRRADWMLYSTFHDPGFVWGAIRAKIRRAAGGKEPAVGRLAERWAIEGIDDGSLIALLHQRGLEVIEHRREFRARLAAIRSLLRLFRGPPTFHLIARLPPAAIGQAE